MYKRQVRDLGTFGGSGADFRAWAATIARHRALDNHRRVAVRPVSAGVPVEDLHHLSDGSDAAEAALTRLGTDTVIALLSTLPSDQAEAVALRVVVGLDSTAAAQVLGKKPGAVRMATGRGLARLAEVLLSTQTEDGYALGVPAQHQPQPGAAPDVTDRGPRALKDVR